MGGAKSRLLVPEDDVVVTSYTSLMESGRRKQCGSGIPLSMEQFSRTAAECPLPRKVFTPFPPGAQAVGRIIRSFAALPPNQCYRRFITKHSPDRLRHRIECLFLPNDEGHLMVCSGIYLLRPGLADRRINNLYDGLVAQWSFGDEGRRDRCSVIRGSRSNNASSCAMTRRGRFLGWPSDGTVVVFDRYAATTCQRDKFYTMDCARAVDFSPDRIHMVVVSSLLRHFMLRIITNFDDDRHSPFRVVKETDLTRFDRTMTMRPGDNDMVSVRFSPSGKSVAVGSKDGHLMVLSIACPEEPMLVDFELLEAPRILLLQLGLANYKSFDYVPTDPLKDDGFERLAFANEFGEVILSSLSHISGQRDSNRFQLIPTNDENRRINNLRCASVEPWLAVGLSSGEIVLLHSKTLRPLSRLPLESADFGPSLVRHPDYTHGFTSLCFSCTDSYLAGGATDGQVRIWCLKRTIGPLTELCRRRIRGICPKEQVKKLPLHPAILEYLKKSLVYRTDENNDV